MNFKNFFAVVIVLIAITSILLGCSEKQETESARIQDFEVEYVFMAQNYKGYSIYDFDYELYDSEKDGNSADNVTGGRYSLHREGNSKYFENAIIVNNNIGLEPLNKYTVTMNIKLGKHFHSDGAVKIYSNDSATYPWAVAGDYIAVIPINDLKENEWTKVSFTFAPTKAFVGIQTPGYVELFIDDVEFKVEEKEEIPLSVSPEFKEYKVLNRDENGNITELEGLYVDALEITDPSLRKNSDLLKITIVAVISILTLVLALFLIRKKGKNKEEQGKEQV